MPYTRFHTWKDLFRLGTEMIIMLLNWRKKRTGGKEYKTVEGVSRFLKKPGLLIRIMPLHLLVLGLRTRVVT